MEFSEEIKADIRGKRYFRLSAQYYLLARHALLNDLIPVGGIMAHHSIERLLLSGLSYMYTQIRLKKKFKSNHNIVEMWNEFKRLFPSERLGKFNDLVSKLNKWHELRFLSEDGLDEEMKVTRHYGDRIKSKKLRNTKEYEINLDELDEFFQKITPLFMDPNILKSVLLTNGAKLTYEAENNYQLIS